MLVKTSNQMIGSVKCRGVNEKLLLMPKFVTKAGPDQNRVCRLVNLQLGSTGQEINSTSINNNQINSDGYKTSPLHMLCTMNTNLKVKGPSPSSICFCFVFFPPLYFPFSIYIILKKDMLDMKSVECRTFDIIAFRSKSISASKSRVETLRKH